MTTIKIRSNVFETNSSSVHTLVFHKTDIQNVIDDTPMDIRGGSYGRLPQPPLTSLYDRLNYLWTAIWEANIKYVKVNTEWIKVLNKEEIQWWKDAIHLYCPNAILYDLKDEDWYGVDHTTLLENLLSAMKTDISILKDFLLDPDGTIYIDGDEFYEDEVPFNRNDLPHVGWTNSEQLIEFKPDSFVYVKGN